MLIEEKALTKNVGQTSKCLDARQEQTTEPWYSPSHH